MEIVQKYHEEVMGILRGFQPNKLDSYSSQHFSSSSSNPPPMSSNPPPPPPYNRMVAPHHISQYRPLMVYPPKAKLELSK